LSQSGSILLQRGKELGTVTGLQVRGGRSFLTSRTKTWTWALVSAVGLSAAAAGAYFSFHFAPAQDRSVLRIHDAPRALPDIAFEDGEGRKRGLSQFRGKAVLLNVWATWCAPCREEMPALDRVQRKLGGPGFEVLALSIDTGGTAAVKRFYDEVGVRSLALYADPTMRATAALGAMGVPTTLLIDAEGRELGRHTGPARWDDPEVMRKIERHSRGG
jgi:thiol-disulfide isomerase/thioredoxin